MVDAKGNRLLRTQARPKRETDVQRENRIRRQLFSAFQKSDRALVALRERREVETTTTTEIPERWTFSESKKSENAAPGSLVKLECYLLDKCVICRENPITHGFFTSRISSRRDFCSFYFMLEMRKPVDVGYKRLPEMQKTSCKCYKAVNLKC